MTSNIIFIGENEVATYPMAPGGKIVLFDRDKSKFYVKTSDGLGQQQIDTYTFTKDVPPQAVTMNDLERFKQEILAMVKGGNSDESTDEQS